MKYTFMRLSAVACALALAPTIGGAQVPSSAFGAPSSSLHGGSSMSTTPAAGTPTAPAWTPRNAAPANASALQTNAVQQANLPIDLAKLNDSAIISIGGKSTPAGDVKRAVLGLDDKAMIIVGGKRVAAAAMKRDLVAASANRPVQTGASLTQTPSARAPVTAAAPNVNANASAGTQTHPRPIKVPPLSRPIASAKRVQIVAASGQVRIEQDRLAQVGLTSHMAAPGVVASTVASITQNPRVTGTEQVPKDGIFSVNNHFTTSPHLTPGGKVGIWGMGFGTQPGAVTLVGGPFEKAPVKLSIVRWTTDTIEATVPSGIRGVPDVDGAVLQVSTSAGKSYRFDNVSFVAAREEQTVTDPQKMLVFVQSITSGSSWQPQGQIGQVRWEGGTSIDCPAVGTDTIHFKAARGFEAIGATMSHGRTDSGDGDADGWPGSRVFSGTYAFGNWNGEDLPVSWGVFRSHTSPRTYLSLDGTAWSDPFYGAFWTAVFVGTPPIGVPAAVRQGESFSPIHSRDPYDECESGWALTSLTVWGPAGVSP